MDNVQKPSNSKVSKLVTQLDLLNVYAILMFTQRRTSPCDRNAAAILTDGRLAVSSSNTGTEVLFPRRYFSLFSIRDFVFLPSKGMKLLK
jgi:hypothetical protein